MRNKIKRNKIISILFLVLSIILVIYFKGKVNESINDDSPSSIANFNERNFNHLKNLESYLLPILGETEYQMYVKSNVCTATLEEVLHEMARSKLDDKLTIFAPNNSISNYLETLRDKFDDSYIIKNYKDSVSVFTDDIMLYSHNNNEMDKIVGIKMID